MKRREFIALVGGAAAWPFAARAQQPAKIPRVVWLAPADVPSRLILPHLRDLGYVEGHNIRLEFRNTEGHDDRLPALAEELVREGNIDAIVALSTSAALAAHAATKTIPILVFAALDPVASGLAKSLAHPGGNVTGIAIFGEETNVKRVELMREVVPHAVRLATVMTHNSRFAQNIESIFETGRKLGFAVEIIDIDDPADLAKSLSPEALAGFDAFVFVADGVLGARSAEVAKLIGLSKKPAIYAQSNFVDNGGLMSFGPDLADAFRRLTAQLDRVLKGEKPGDLPFDRPTKFQLIINLITARTMGIELSPALLARADRVIE